MSSNRYNANYSSPVGLNRSNNLDKLNKLSDKLNIINVRYTFN